MPRFDPSPDHPAEAPDPRLESLLRHLVALGAMLMLVLPEARGSHIALGALPLWLLAMPLTAWWALHRFAVPAWWTAGAADVSPLRRRARPQARRRARAARSLALPRAA